MGAEPNRVFLNASRRRAAFVAVVISALACALLLGALPRVAYAAPESAAGIQVGDHIFMGSQPAGYTGKSYWRVLDKGADGNLLLMSEYLWTGDGTNALDFIKFKNVERDTDEDKSPVWQGSNAQAWCQAFETAVLGGVSGLRIVPTTKSDAEFASPDSGEVVYAATENILNGDKVFFLSAEEVAHYMPTKEERVAYLNDGINKTDPESWWLRSPRRYNPSHCAGKVLALGDSRGALERGYVYNLGALRPALWADLSVVSLSGGCSHNGSKTWFVGANSRSYSDAPTYTWRAGNASCAAKKLCAVCGEVLVGEKVDATVQVIKPATATEDGYKRFTARFADAAFTTQTKTVKIPKDPSLAGDSSEGGQNGGQQGGTEAGTGTDGSQGGTPETPLTTDGKDGQDSSVTQKGIDGTALGPGASAAAAEAAIAKVGAKSDADPAGTVFGKLQLRSTKQTKNSITVKWTKVAGAKKYVLFGSLCGKGKKLVKVAGTTKTSFKVTKAAGKKLAKGKYYKFMAVALDANNNVVSTSKVIHVATKGGKVGNCSKVTTKAKKNKASIEKGKTFNLGANQVLANKKLKAKKHAALRYESSNTKIATVNKKGVVKAKAKGTCFVYAYAQSGAFAKVKVIVMR